MTKRIIIVDEAFNLADVQFVQRSEIEGLPDIISGLSAGNYTVSDTRTSVTVAVTGEIVEQAPGVLTPLTLEPETGMVGTIYTVTWPTFSGTPAPTVVNKLYLDGIDITSSMVGNAYVSVTAGSLLATSTAANGVGVSATASDSATVFPSVAPPAALSVTFDPVAPVEGGTVTATVSATGTAPITYGLTVAGATVTGSNPYTFTVPTDGIYSWSASASNAGGTSTASGTLDVSAADTAPEILAFAFSASSYTVGNTATLSWTLGGGTADTVTPAVTGPSGSVALSGSGSSRTFTVTEAGSYSATLSVSGPAGSDSASASATASAAPALTATISPSPADIGDTITLTFNYSPDTLTALQSGTPLTVSGSGITRTVTASAAGNISFTATKAGYSGWSGSVTVESGVAAVVSSISANGYLAVWADGTPPTFDPEGNPVVLTAQTPGFDATLAATTHAIPLTITSRRRVLRTSENLALFGAGADNGDLARHPRTESEVVLSWDVILGAVIAGTVNNSTRTSPKPIARWITPDRFLAGNDPFNFEFVAFHRSPRNGEPCAGALVTVASASTPTVPLLSYVTSAVVVSEQSLSGNAITCYRVTIDPSTLPDEANYVINAKVYPWIGDASSVLDSADGTSRNVFSPRYFAKNVARKAAPYILVIDPNHASASWDAGAVSTDPAVARATPWTSIPNAMRYGVHTPGLDHSHCEFWLASGITVTADITNSAARKQTVAALTIRTDPEAEVTATLTLNGVPRLGIETTPYGLPTGCMSFKDINLVRGAITDCEMMIGAGCVLDANGGNSPLAGTVSRVSYRGCTITGTLGSAFFESRTDLAIGVVCEDAASAGFSATLIGNQIKRIGRPAQNSSFIAFNSLTFGLANQGVFYGGVFVQNAVSFLSGAGEKVLKVSADGEAYSTDGTIIWHNSLAGSAAMRANMFYDETSGTFRTHTRLSVIGNLTTIRAAFKGDLFLADSTSPHSGAEEWSYGVGVFGNIFGGTTNFLHDYDGLNGIFNGPEADPRYSSAEVAPLWTKDGSAGGDGTGVSDLRITSTASPAYQRVRDLVALKYDLDGNVRTGSHADAGAYKVAA